MRRAACTTVLARGACAALLASAALAQAGETGAVPGRIQETWMAVSDDSLDTQRGGFDIGSGLLVSFGITRATYVNGGLVAQTTLNFGDVAKLTPAQTTELGRQLSAVHLVQNGPGNTVDPQTGAIGGTIIQNTLNNQRIANTTVINTQTNGMSLMKDLNSAGAITEGIARAVGGR